MSSGFQVLFQQVSNTDMSKFNQLSRYRDRNQSSFRVHFYLKNVYYNNQIKLTNYLQDISARISKIAQVHIIQVFGSVRKIVDLSIGLQNDSQAIQLYQTQKKIYLPAQNGKPIEHQPIFSQSFKGYIKYLQQKRIKTSSITQKESLKHSPKQEKRQLPSDIKRKSNEQEPSIIKNQPQALKYYSVFIFCIPLEFKDKEVVNIFTQNGLKVKSYEWKYKQDMQYLHIQFVQSLTQAQILSYDFRLEKYPLLVTPKYQEQQINQMIMKLQTQLNFQKDIDEIELMKCADSIGGVVSMIKDQFYGPKKYVVAFNNISNTTRFEQTIQAKYKVCKMSKPKFIVRLCRLQKNFTFSQMMDNLASYQLELKKIGLSSQQKLQY